MPSCFFKIAWHSTSQVRECRRLELSLPRCAFPLCLRKYWCYSASGSDRCGSTARMQPAAMSLGTAHRKLVCRWLQDAPPLTRVCGENRNLDIGAVVWTAESEHEKLWRFNLCRRIRVYAWCRP